MPNLLRTAAVTALAGAALAGCAREDAGEPPRLPVEATDTEPGPGTAGQGGIQATPPPIPAETVWTDTTSRPPAPPPP
jgi:hypothetical protein